MSYGLVSIIGIILFLILIIIISTIFLFKHTPVKPTHKEFKLKYCSIYGLVTIVYIGLFYFSAWIYRFDSQYLSSCGFLCSNYTNSYVNIIIGLAIYFIDSVLYYLISKKIVLKFHIEGSKLKYLILSIYTIILLCTFFLSFCIFVSFLGDFIINNIIINIMRWIIIFIPLIFYPIDIFIRPKKKKSS